MNTEQNKDRLDDTQPENMHVPEQPAEAESAETAEAAGEAAEVQQTEGPEKEESPAETEEKPAPAEKVPWKEKINMYRWKRSGMATLLSVVFIAIVVVLNILVTALTERFPSMNIDLTVQKLNSLSDQALEIAKGVEKDTEIFLVGTEEAYRKDMLYANYGFKYSQVANLAQRLEEANSHIKVEFVDPDTNPDLMALYSEDRLTTGMVLVRTDKRYKILSVADLFDMQQNQMTMASETYTKADSALAGALEMVNMDKVPVLTLATGHGELLSSGNMSQFMALMEARNFSVQEVDILTEEIPEDTQVLMIPTPSNDYTAEEIQKLQDFLNDPDREEPVALLCTCHPTQGELPRLNSFLEEWGIQVHQGVVAESDTGRMAAANASYILVDPAGGTPLDGNTYNRLLAPSSAPLSLLFDSNADITTRTLWQTGNSAYVITQTTTQEEASNPETAQWAVAAMADRKPEVNGNESARYVIVFGSSYIFTDDFFTATAFGNQSYITDLLQYTTATDGSAVTVETNAIQTNVLDVTCSQSTATLLGLGVFTVGLPLLILAAGLVIFLKRRHL